MFSTFFLKEPCIFVYKTALLTTAAALSFTTKLCGLIKQYPDFVTMHLIRGLFLLTTLLSPVFGLGYQISNNTVPLMPPWKEYEYRGVYSAEVVVGSQVFQLALDTGSSDTWVLAMGANCTDSITLQPVPPAECGYSGTRFEPDALSFEVIPDMHLNTSYGNGAAINGLLGYSELILGGLTIPRQEISAITYAAVAGIPEGNVSGILGLCYPSLTSAFPGTDPSKDKRCQDNSSCGPILYSPIIDTIFKDELTEPVFSVALSRSSSFGGIMTIGGIPRLDTVYVNATEGIAATSPIKPLGNMTILSAYTTEVGSFVYTNASATAGRGLYVLDSGTIPNVFHQKAADAINALFVPPAVFNTTTGRYVVACDAKAPELGISIGGQVFYHNPEDMILEYGDLCLSAVQGSLSDVLILGASWLKSVLAIFDVGASEMTFVSRPYYEDS